MPRTVLVRHADVENPRGIFYGHLDTFGLSAFGRAQALELGPALVDLGVQQIVHSPLRRARETAELAASRMGRDVELVEEMGLIELEFGKYLQGVPYWQIPFRRPRWFVHHFRRGFLQNDETVQTMGERIVRVAERLVTERPGEVVACVSHGDPLQAAWVLLEGRPPTERELGRKRVARAGMLIVDFDEAARATGVMYRPPPTPTP